MPPEPDPLDDILNLEEQFYQEGYEEGLKDGAEAGKIEGRWFGIQKGWVKFFESGRLHSKATVWANRCELAHPTSGRPTVDQGAQPIPDAQNAQPLSPMPGFPMSKNQGKDVSNTAGVLPASPTTLPPEGQGPSQKWAVDQRKKRKAINMILELLEPSTLSFKNETVDVDDFDSRMKGALSRLKVIEMGIGPREKGYEGGDDAAEAAPERTDGQMQWTAPKAVKNEW